MRRTVLKFEVRCPKLAAEAGDILILTQPEAGPTEAVLHTTLPPDRLTIIRRLLEEGKVLRPLLATVPPAELGEEVDHGTPR